VSERDTARRSPALVIFDLDGTITHRDTLLGYVVGFGLTHRGRIFGLPRMLPELWRFVRGWSDHGRLKSAFIRAVMRGADRSEISLWTQTYLAKLLQQGVFFNALKQIEQHRVAGDHLVLMSATVDLYVPELATTLGFDEWNCTQVTWAGYILEGQLTGPNVRDEEKAHRLRELLPRFAGREVIAYGNSLPDLPHLRLADRRILINAGRALRKAASGMEVDFRHWR